MGLNKFIVNAKINSYATIGEGGEKKLEDGSKELVFEENPYKYRDRYFGFSPFVGEEVVWKNHKPIWGMNYYGKIISNSIQVDKIYLFLQKALRLVKIKKPFRGPDNFTDGEFSYESKSKGNIEQFQGVESIYYRGTEVFRLYYHGGLIKKN